MAWSYTQASHNSGWSDTNTNILWVNHWSVTEQTPDNDKIKLRVEVVTEQYHVSPSSYVSPVRDTISYGGTTVEVNTGSLTPASHDYTYTKDVYVPAEWAGKTIELYICWTKVSVVCGATGNFASTISASNGNFGSPVQITLTRKVAGTTHTVTVTCGGSTVTLLTKSTATSVNWPAALATYGPLIPNAMSGTATITCTTYLGSTSQSSTKSITMSFKAADVKPTVSTGWATHAKYNTGTAAASIDAYVQGYSKATVTFDTSKISTKYGATIASYKIVCGNVSDTDSPYLTGTLTGTSASIACYVYDSRGQSASGTLSVSLYAYAKPTLSNVNIFRCDSSGNADEDGTYIAVQATQTFSSIGGKNSATMTAYTKLTSASSYTSKGTMTSGTKKILSTYSADTSYDVKIEVKDSLNNTATYVLRLPTRTWAMKFRPTGDGVGFGKAPENAKSLEMPSDWIIRFGTKQFQPGIISGTFESGDTALATHAVGTFFTWKSNHVKCTTAIAIGDTIEGKVSQMSVDYVLANKELKTYTNVNQLGLTSGSATIAATYEALPLNSLLIAQPGQFASGELPHTYGVVVMGKAGYQYRGFVHYYGKMLAYDDYHMPLDDNQTPNGHWQRDVSLYDSGTATGTNISWYYRKWSDGRVEAWGSFSASVAITTSGYGAFRSAAIDINIPAAIGLNSTSYWINGQKANANAAEVMSVYPSTATLAKMYLRDSASETLTCNVNIYVCGTWR